MNRMNLQQIKKTRDGARWLRTMIRKNGAALIRTAPLIIEAIEDDDTDFALQEIEHAESQLGGLKAMLARAQSLAIPLVGEESGPYVP